MKLQRNDAPILVVFGQSNAHGHGTHLSAEEEIRIPLTNVFGLGCEYNQAYGLKDVTWSGFVTKGMNLGETQDNTSLPCGKLCEIVAAEDGQRGAPPPLYVIQISIGSMGIAEHERDGLNMWWQGRPPVMVKGALGDVNISLYPLAVQILSLAVKNLKAPGKKPVILGLHWNQWETEALTGRDSITNARQNYMQLFCGFRAPVEIRCPIWLYRPLSDVYCNPEAVKSLTELFEDFVQSGEDFHLMDLSKSSLWNPKRPDKGIFQDDLVHYSPQAHRFFAKCQMEKIILKL